MNNELWIVYDREDGVPLITDDYEEALEEYEKYKNLNKDYVSENGEFDMEERVVLAKVDKMLFAYDTEKPSEDGQTYWDWKEEDYKLTQEEYYEENLNKEEDKKMFMLNEDGVAEWIVANTKYQALEYATSLWGISTVLEYFQEAKENDPELTYVEWYEDFVIEEDLEKDFTLHYEDGSKATKKTKDWLEEIKVVPHYFACSEY